MSFLAPGFFLLIMSEASVVQTPSFHFDVDDESLEVNTVDEKKEKLSDCEKSFYTKEDGSIGCKCAKRTTPPAFDKAYFEKAFTVVSQMKGDLSENCANFLKENYKASSMNICQTQPLPVIKISKMTVELKDGKAGTKAKRTSRVILVPLAMKE